MSSYCLMFPEFNIKCVGDETLSISSNQEGIKVGIAVSGSDDCTVFTILNAEQVKQMCHAINDGGFNDIGQSLKLWFDIVFQIGAGDSDILVCADDVEKFRNYLASSSVEMEEFEGVGGTRLKVERENGQVLVRIGRLHSDSDCIAVLGSEKIEDAIDQIDELLS